MIIYLPLILASRLLLLGAAVQAQQFVQQE